jgi:hypothetical protein
MPCLSCKRRGACRIRVPEVVGRFPIVPSWRHCISGCLEHACAPEMTSAETVFDMCRTTGWNNEGTRRCAVPGCHEFDPSDFMWNACPRMALPDSQRWGVTDRVCSWRALFARTYVKTQLVTYRNFLQRCSSCAIPRRLRWPGNQRLRGTVTIGSVHADATSWYSQKSADTVESYRRQRPVHVLLRPRRGDSGRIT